MTPHRALRKAIKAVGSQAALAMACGVSQQAVQQWLDRGRVPASRVKSVVAACDGAVSAYGLRPDLFGPKPE